MSRILISYSRKDAEIATDLYQFLKKHHFDVWMDITDLEAGDRWEESIVTEIETCSAFIIIVTHSSARSLYVIRELTYAIEFKKQIFPLCLEGEPGPLLARYQCANRKEDLIPGLKRLTQVFIYHTPEDEVFASRLADNLIALGVNVWQGDSSKRQQGLTSSHIMLLIVSRKSMESPEIRAEWDAFDSPKKSIIPIIVRNTPVLTKLRDKTYIDFLNQDDEIAFAQLYGVLASLDVNMKDHESVAILPQPPLPLDRRDMFFAAKKSVLMCGLVLDFFARDPDVLSEALIRNPDLKVRLLMLKLNVKLANEAGAWVGINSIFAGNLKENETFENWVKQQRHALTPKGRWIAQRLYQNQKLLQSIQAQAPDRVFIKTFSHRFGMAYFIIDHRDQDGMLTASPYFYDIDYIQSTRHEAYNIAPIFLSKSSSKQSDLWWFDQYTQEFERLWDKSEKWKPAS